MKEQKIQLIVMTGAYGSAINIYKNKWRNGNGAKKGRKFPYGLILQLQSASAHTLCNANHLYIIPPSSVKTQSCLVDYVIIQYLLSTNLNKEELKKLLKISLRKLIESSWNIWHQLFQSSGLLCLVSRSLSYHLTLLVWNPIWSNTLFFLCQSHLMILYVILRIEFSEGGKIKHHLSVTFFSWRESLLHHQFQLEWPSEIFITMFTHFGWVILGQSFSFSFNLYHIGYI